MALRGCQSTSELAWRRDQRRLGRQDGRSGRPGTHSDQYYQKGWREGRRDWDRKQDSAFLALLPEVDFIEYSYDDCAVDSHKLAAWVRKILADPPYVVVKELVKDEDMRVSLLSALDKFDEWDGGYHGYGQLWEKFVLLLREALGPAPAQGGDRS